VNSLNTSPSNDTTGDILKDLSPVNFMANKGVPQRVKGSTSTDAVLRTFMQKLKSYVIAAVTSGVGWL
jgi:hypothetical protein